MFRFFCHQLKWINWLLNTLPISLLNQKTGSKVLSVETKESSTQINLVLIFQIRTGVIYIYVKMEIACTIFQYFSGVPRPTYKKLSIRKKNCWKTLADKRAERRNHQKHRLFNIWKKNPSEQAHTILKYQRTLVNRRLNTAQNEFCKHFYQRTTNK